MILSPEYRVLAAAAAPGAARGDRPSSDVWSGVRWDRLLALAEWHRLSPLVHRRVTLPEEAPDHVSQHLEHDYLENAARNLYLREQLTLILKARPQCDRIHHGE